MASRFNSHISQREPRSSLFAGYDERPSSRSPAGNRSTNRYGYAPPESSSRPADSGFAAYPSSYPASGPSSSAGQFRTATPNSKGQYSDAVLSELESQNDEHVSGILAKVGRLKEVTIAIGDEIRDSTALAEKMNDSFDNTTVRLRGTMKRMLRMAEKTGVGWKVWVAFFAAVILLFWYVWLF
ncbi:v-SNARE [Trichodelitschia bisporula]|uniref:V-SNARE n=1 Tax=Trichodelitschia bisporula TaxID=703511 RepID=A0A6G1IAT2_9PEZI|nr:v-SNARE [Trichodelitschia bisporula]